MNTKLLFKPVRYKLGQDNPADITWRDLEADSSLGVIGRQAGTGAVVPRGARATLQGIGRTKTSATPLVSFATRSLALLTNATTRPSALSATGNEKSLPLAVPALLTLTSVVVGARNLYSSA